MPQQTPFDRDIPSPTDVSQAMFGPWQELLQRWTSPQGASPTQSGLSGVERLTESAVRMQLDWLRSMRGMISDQMPGAAFAHGWFTAAETQLQTQARLWEHWLEYSAQLQQQWLQSLPAGMDALQNATAGTATGRARRGSR